MQPLFDTDVWWQKQLRLIRNLNFPSILFVCNFYFYLFFLLLLLYCVQWRGQAWSREWNRKKKTWRPSKNAEREREWTDEEIFKLIDLWANHECLYNIRSSAYLNKHKRSHALDKIVQAFRDTEKPPTRSQVQLKITRLRNYYGGENNKVEKSKTIGGDLDSVYVPKWEIFVSNSSIYNSDNPPSAKSARKMLKGQKSNTEEVMATATKALENISSRYNDSLGKKGKVHEDRNLVEMIYTMLQTYKRLA